MRSVRAAGQRATRDDRRLPDTVGKESQVHRQALGADHFGAPQGRIEAMVCTACGYLQLFVADPRTVDFGALEGFCWLSPAEGGPYR